MVEKAGNLAGSWKAGKDSMVEACDMQERCIVNEGCLLF
jgi:hypothetical protein